METTLSALPRGWRYALYVGLVLILALGVWGYRSPSIALAWETLVALCGF